MKVKFANCIWNGKVAEKLRDFSKLCDLQDCAQIVSDPDWVEDIQKDIDKIIAVLPASVASNPRYRLLPEYIEVLED